MLLHFLKDDIIEGLQKSANIIPTKTGAAFLRTIWLKAENDSLQIMSTDSNIEFSGAYPATVAEPGLAGVQGRTFSDLMKKLPPGKITLRLDPEAKTLHIEHGSRKFKLPTNDVSWFQKFSDFPESDNVFLSGEYFQELIDKTAFCISEEDTMEAIACMSIRPNAAESSENNIETCALNGHQFAMQRFEHQGLCSLLPAEGMLIQKKYINELKKWLPLGDIECNINNKRLFFRTEDKRETFSLPLSYYQFPEYHNFLGKLSEGDLTTMEVNRLDLMNSLDRILLFNSENNRCTYFDLKSDALILTTQGQEIGSASESLDFTFSGSLSLVAFPTRNLIEILSHYSSETVKFTLTGTEGPCGIVGEDDSDYTVIIMPMKIVEETYYSEETI